MPTSRWWYAGAAFALALGISFAPSDVALRVGLAVLAAGLGYQLGQRQTQLHAESVTDPLTRLYNRRYFEACLLRELARHERHGGSLALLMVDVDAMKQFNDRGGHDAGDLALCAVADALRDSCRGSDLVARWGGDEFVVLAPHTTEADAEHLSQRISKALQASSVQVSIGVGMAIATDASSQLFARADAALYVVKGRRHVLVLAPAEGARRDAGAQR